MFKSLQYYRAKDWILLSIINFLIVGIFGLLMRLKFLFPLPFLDQKNIMHAHSHFAFSGWVTQAIMIFMILIISGKEIKDIFPKKYQSVLIANLLGAFGMLISFTFNGYSVLSIICSFAVILVSYWFSFIIWKDLSKSSLPSAIIILFKAALIYNVLSSLGTYSLVYLKITHQLDPLKQLASVYFYLHFQYNGWFFFGCLALANYYIFKKSGTTLINNRFSLMYSLTVPPAFFLSILWWKGFPNWLYLVLLFTVILQIFLWVKFLFRTLSLQKTIPELRPNRQIIILWFCVVCAVSIKLILQAISIIPSLSQLVYGFRPIVIAYLHLVLLVIISLFLLGYAFSLQGSIIRKGVKIGIYGLLLGIILNELTLMVQGIGGLLRYNFHGTHETLGFAALIIVISLIVIIYNQLGKFINETKHN